ncbi:MAG TPA: TIR domain-containing protein [Candidatus Acidoferrales bacterium]|nr:TIR domain-containing protein [Candidatus Acidoferrales bacterium]
MARRAFFSFHYERDVWRAGQIRNSWVTKPDREAAGFWDAVAWEEVKKKGEDAIKAWIRNQMDGTSVTAVLIGAETASRPYVKYEIDQSWAKGNGLFGIYIHSLKDSNSKTDVKGSDPFDGYKNIKTYDWVNDKGYENIADWIESAYKRAQDRKV